ncbi:hypothetical protein, partial [Azotobacter beijerinckii]
MASLKNVPTQTHRPLAPAQSTDPAGNAPDAPIPVPNIVPVVLEARPGAPEVPAVRIFLGTQPEQHRAERIF